MKEQPGSSGTAGEPQHHALSPSFAGSAGIATVGGALIALQILFNGALGAAGSGPLLASFVSYLGTLVSAILVIAVIGQAAEVFLTIRKKGRPWWFMVGGSQRGLLHWWANGGRTAPGLKGNRRKAEDPPDAESDPGRRDSRCRACFGNRPWHQ